MISYTAQIVMKNKMAINNNNNKKVTEVVSQPRKTMSTHEQQKEEAGIPICVGIAGSN